MSHFHFPRLYFSGKASVDPATGNNNYHYPLVNFEPITGECVLPPRIYLDNKETIILAKQNIQNFDQYHKVDSDNNSYLEISCISTSNIFKKWMVTPLGSFEDDKNFHELYKQLNTQKDAVPLFGQCPAYWNYYGTMNFHLHNVHVHNIETELTNFNSRMEAKNNLATENQFRGAKLSFEFDNGKNSAVMIDVSPTLSLYSQIFCSSISLTKKDQILLRGKPLKSSLRQMNTSRVENDQMITGSSGTFYQSIPLSNINKEESKDLLQFFIENNKTDQTIKGICLRFDLSEVKENTQPDYNELGENSNPAYLQINGCIAPWYTDEMISHPPGRRLNYFEPYKTGSYLGATFAYFHKKQNVLSLDIIGSLPQMCHKNVYTTIDIGKLDLVIIEDNSIFNIGTINTCDKIAITKLFKSKSGIIDFKIQDPLVISMLQKGNGRLEIRHRNKILLKEKELRIISDQSGIYADEGEPETEGFLANSSKREHCKIKVLYRGKQYNEGLKVMLLELSVLPFGRGDSFRIINHIQSIRNNQIIPWSTKKAGQFFYIFIPIEHETMPIDLKHYMVKTGDFINLRVLPFFDQSKYNDQNISFEDIYHALLKNFDLIYPSSSIITPFNKRHLLKAGKFLKKIMAEEYWGEYLYMPSSREMPKGKKEMFFKWINKNEKIR